MTDNVEKLPVQDQSPLINDERIEAIKIYLFQNVLKKYQEFSLEVNNLTIDNNLKRIIIEKLDDAWLWIKEAFNVLQVQLPERPTTPNDKRDDKTKKKR